MVKTFHIVIKTFLELNTISNIINTRLYELNADFVSMYELALPTVDVNLSGTMIVVAYKTK